MRIDYTVFEDAPNLMYHVSRQRAYETVCYGCNEPYETAWPHGALLSIITDRSGSEQCDTHNNSDCRALAIERLIEEENATFYASEGY